MTDIACKGVIRFLGPHAESGKMRVGIELDEPLGKHNGSPKGGDHTYFVCAKKHGLLVPQEKVQLETETAIATEEFGGFGDSAAPAAVSAPPPPAQLLLDSGAADMMGGGGVDL